MGRPCKCCGTIPCKECVLNCVKSDDTKYDYILRVNVYHNVSNLGNSSYNYDIYIGQFFNDFIQPNPSEYEFLCNITGNIDETNTAENPITHCFHTFSNNNLLEEYKSFSKKCFIKNPLIGNRSYINFDNCDFDDTIDRSKFLKDIVWIKFIDKDGSFDFPDSSGHYLVFEIELIRVENDNNNIVYVCTLASEAYYINSAGEVQCGEFGEIDCVATKLNLLQEYCCDYYCNINISIYGKFLVTGEFPSLEDTERPRPYGGILQECTEYVAVEAHLGDTIDLPSSIKVYINGIKAIQGLRAGNLFDPEQSFWYIVVLRTQLEDEYSVTIEYTDENGNIVNCEARDITNNSCHYRVSCYEKTNSLVIETVGIPDSWTAIYERNFLGTALSTVSFNGTSVFNGTFVFPTCAYKVNFLNTRPTIYAGSGTCVYRSLGTCLPPPFLSISSKITYDLNYYYEFPDSIDLNPGNNFGQYKLFQFEITRVTWENQCNGETKIYNTVQEAIDDGISLSFIPPASMWILINEKSNLYNNVDDSLIYSPSDYCIPFGTLDFDGHDHYFLIENEITTPCDSSYWVGNHFANPIPDCEYYCYPGSYRTLCAYINAGNAFDYNNFTSLGAVRLYYANL